MSKSSDESWGNDLQVVFDGPWVWAVQKSHSPLVSLPSLSWTRRASYACKTQALLTFLFMAKALAGISGWLQAVIPLIFEVTYLEVSKKFCNSWHCNLRRAEIPEAFFLKWVEEIKYLLNFLCALIKKTNYRALYQGPSATICLIYWLSTTQADRLTFTGGGGWWDWHRLACSWPLKMVQLASWGLFRKGTEKGFSQLCLSGV